MTIEQSAAQGVEDWTCQKHLDAAEQILRKSGRRQAADLIAAIIEVLARLDASEAFYEDARPDPEDVEESGESVIRTAEALMCEVESAAFTLRHPEEAWPNYEKGGYHDD